MFALALCGMFAFTGCTTETTEYLLSHYSGEDKDADGNLLINQNLFYTNQIVQGAPDSAVLDDTANSGYYYLYSTSGNLFIRRSTNLAEWEDVGNAISRTDSEIANITAANIWAPECIYDSETELYYLFFSASPTYDYDAHSGNGAALRTFVRTFSGVVGMALIEYLAAFRISTTCELIATHGELSMADIANAVGYIDQSYFSRMFKKIKGVTPTEYAANYDGEDPFA